MYFYSQISMKRFTKLAYATSFLFFLSVCDKVQSLRKSRRLVVFVVFSALFVDSMLLTVITPILPKYIERLQCQKVTKYQVKFQNSTKLNSVRAKASGIHQRRINNYDNQSIIGCVHVQAQNLGFLEKHFFKIFVQTLSL